MRNGIRSNRSGWNAAVAVLAACLLSSAGLACGSCDEEEVYAFLAYIDFRGMTEQQQNEAAGKAIAAYHEKQMELARSRFSSRFKIEPVAPTG